MAVRKKNETQYTVIYVNHDFQNSFRRMKVSNWVEKLYAVLLFKTSNSLLKSHDIIQIDTDFQESAKYVKRYMERLFGKYNFGTDRNKPCIQFIPARFSEQVRLAHKYSKKARYGQLKNTKNPDVTNEFEHLIREH